MAKVFLGGTLGGSKWREELIRMLKIGYFNPDLGDPSLWTEKAQQKEAKARETCEYRLFWFTPEIKGVFAIAELIDESNKRPTGTLFGFDVISTIDPELKLSLELVKSLAAVGRMVERNGGRWFKTLSEVATYLNERNHR